MASLPYAFTDALQNEKTLSWWNCHNVDKSNISWMPMVAAIAYQKSSGLNSRQSGLELPKWSEIQRLMEAVSLGRIDGSFNSSFASVPEMYGYLMRTVGIDEGTIVTKTKAMLEADYPDASYYAGIRVRKGIEDQAKEFISFLGDNGYAEGLEVLNKIKADGNLDNFNNHLASQGSQSTSYSPTVGTRLSTTTLPKKKKTPFSLRGIEENQSSGFSMVTVAALSIGLLCLLKKPKALNAKFDQYDI